MILFVKSTTVSYVWGLLAGITFILMYNLYGWIAGTLVILISAVIFEVYKRYFDVEPDVILHKETENGTTEDFVNEVQEALRESFKKNDEKNN